MFKVVPISLPEVHHLLNIIRRGVRDLDRVRLDVCNSQAEFLLHIVLEVNHEQRASFCNDVVNVTRIPCGVVELSARQSVHGVDRDLERLTQLVEVVVLRDLN